MSGRITGAMRVRAAQARAFKRVADEAAQRSREGAVLTSTWVQAVIDAAEASVNANPHLGAMRISFPRYEAVSIRDSLARRCACHVVEPEVFAAAHETLRAALENEGFTVRSSELHETSANDECHHRVVGVEVSW